MDSTRKTSLRKLSCFFAIFLFHSIFFYAGAIAQPVGENDWQVCFSPKGGCTDQIIRQIEGAKSLILVQAYSFTSKPISTALAKAHFRGVNVNLIVDKSQRKKGEQAAYLSSIGVPVSIDSVHAIAHNKVMVIDGETVITGSFNFTAAAEKSNAENVLIIRDKNLALQYVENWKKHKTHSESLG